MAQNPPALTGRPFVRPDEVDRLQKRIDELRGEIGRDVYELESRIRETFDLRRQVARHPVVAAVLAFGGALVVVRIGQSLLGGVGPPGAPRARMKEVLG